MKNLTHMLISRRVALGTVVSALTAPSLTYAASYPDKPIKVVVPYAPGGTGDVIARLAGQSLSASLGQQVIIDNKAGGAGVIGATAVARGEPDGYTLLLGYTSEMVIVPALLKNAPYATERDFQPITLAGTTPLVLIASQASGIKSFDDLIAKAKSKPDAVTYASAGNGSPAHVAGALLGKAIGAQMLHVPYKGGAQAVADVVSGMVDIYFSGIPPTVGFIKSGRVTALGVASKNASPALPGVPALAQRVSSLDLSGWFGFFAPKKVSAPVIELLHAKVHEAFQAPAMKAKLIEQGVETSSMSRAAFNDFVLAEQRRYKQLLTELNIQSD
ncbi:Bug family tripartite tricarboxylate transporter substrate binding protein [Ottowia thiooxydans]|uniref:Tripartite-type tricarboxylate transporter receptor subunit TctC n=1 Tax=Ottowia thiooxydans TaxID=219182 RepID=A0ABV2QB06_9BURK